MLGLILLITFLCVFLLYTTFFPKTNAVYKDENNSQVRVLNFNWKTVVIQYIKFNAELNEIEEEITGPQNIGLFVFINTFNLWTLI